VDFPITFVGSMNPFRKNCVFSADIEKDVISTRTETYERPKPLPNVQDFKVLMSLRSKLLEGARKILRNGNNGDTGPGALIRIVMTILSMSDAELLPINEVEGIFYDYFDGMVMSSAEKVALLSAYDVKDNSRVAMEDFRQLFKRTPSLRRLELIGLFYSLIDPLSEGVVSFSALESQFRSGGYGVNIKAAMFMEFLRSLNSNAVDFSADDYFDYYVEVSSEMEHDDNFEELLKKTWGALQR
jgi:hypothetical protein